jgi:hypothetical protein
MKVTLKQKKQIIKETKKCVKNFNAKFLCFNLTQRIKEILSIDCHYSPEEIQAIFPRFTWKNANRYFADEQTRKNSPAWWDSNEIKKRLQFLDYILTGKLPSKKKVKK